MKTSFVADLLNDSIRVAQAHALWAHGFGIGLDLGGEDGYLKSIPLIPNFLPGYWKYFDRLVLVDRRLSLSKQCTLLDVHFRYGDDQYFADLDSDVRPKVDVYWMLCQDGSRYRGKHVAHCKQAFSEIEVGCDVFEGLAMFAQDPTSVCWSDSLMDLPSSVRRSSRDYNACLRVHDCRPDLHCEFGSTDVGNRGSASRGKFVG